MAQFECSRNKYLSFLGFSAIKLIHLIAHSLYRYFYLMRVDEKQKPANDTFPKAAIRMRYLEIDVV